MVSMILLAILFVLFFIFIALLGALIYDIYQEKAGRSEGYSLAPTSPTENADLHDLDAPIGRSTKNQSKSSIIPLTEENVTLHNETRNGKSTLTSPTNNQQGPTGTYASKLRDNVPVNPNHGQLNRQPLQSAKNEPDVQGNRQTQTNSHVLTNLLTTPGSKKQIFTRDEQQQSTSGSITRNTNVVTNSTTEQAIKNGTPLVHRETVNDDGSPTELRAKLPLNPNPVQVNLGPPSSVASQGKDPGNDQRQNNTHGLANLVTNAGRTTHTTTAGNPPRGADDSITTNTPVLPASTNESATGQETALIDRETVNDAGSLAGLRAKLPLNPNPVQVNLGPPSSVQNEGDEPGKDVTQNNTHGLANLVRTTGSTTHTSITDEQPPRVIDSLTSNTNVLSEWTNEPASGQETALVNQERENDDGFLTATKGSVPVNPTGTEIKDEQDSWVAKLRGSVPINPSPIETYQEAVSNVAADNMQGNILQELGSSSLLKPASGLGTVELASPSISKPANEGDDSRLAAPKV